MIIKNDNCIYIVIYSYNKNTYVFVYSRNFIYIIILLLPRDLL